MEELSRRRQIKKASRKIAAIISGMTKNASASPAEGAKRIGLGELLPI